VACHQLTSGAISSRSVCEEFCASCCNPSDVKAVGHGGGLTMAVQACDSHDGRLWNRDRSRRLEPITAAVGLVISAIPSPSSGGHTGVKSPEIPFPVPSAPTESAALIHPWNRPSPRLSDGHCVLDAAEDPQAACTCTYCVSHCAWRIAVHFPDVLSS
jgi:hypothetical protein